MAWNKATGAGTPKLRDFFSFLDNALLLSVSMTFLFVQLQEGKFKERIKGVQKIQTSLDKMWVIFVWKNKKNKIL